MTGTPPATNDGEQDLQSARRLLQVAFGAGDVTALGTLITDDVIWIAADRQPWVGRSDVLDRLGRFFDQFDYDFQLDVVRIDRDGDRVLEQSNFTSRVVSDDESQAVHPGAVIIVWVRQDRWRISTYLDVGDPLLA